VQVRHVERAGDPVKQAHPRQEQDRRDEVQRHVLDPAIELLAPPTEDQEAEGRDQHHLEPDVEVEEVAGQERPADPGQQHLEQGVVAQRLLRLVHVGQGVDRDGKAGDAGDHHHDRAQQVRDERDAEGRGPLAHLRGDDTFAQDLGHQEAGRDQQAVDPDDREPAPLRPAPEQEGQHRRGEGNDDRGGENPAHLPLSPSGSASRISSEFSVPRFW
jgi:hypothetical protein